MMQAATTRANAARENIKRPKMENLAERAWRMAWVSQERRVLGNKYKNRVIGDRGVNSARNVPDSTNRIFLVRDRQRGFEEASTMKPGALPFNEVDGLGRIPVAWSSVDVLEA
jgi:hypothetical protein